MSAIGWVDYSSAERERVSQVLSMLKEKGTLDELGIGQIRDAFADVLFPGFSTIQTRAKYFITLSYIFQDYRNLDDKLRVKTDLHSFIREKEDALAVALVKNHEDDDPYGIIGKESLEKGVARKPSSVYWNGLRQFGIVRKRLSFKEFSNLYQHTVNQGQHKHHEEDDDNKSSVGSLLTQPPNYQSNWLEHIRIELSTQEAEYIKDKLRMSSDVADSVPAQIIKHDLLTQVVDLDNELVDPNWRIQPLFEFLKSTSVSEKCKTTLACALDFSSAMEGAHIRYNYLIAKHANNNALLAECEHDFEQWLAEVRQHPTLFDPTTPSLWFNSAFVNGKRIKTNTQSFVEKWLALMREKASIVELDACVEKRAKANKGARCMLNKGLPESQRWVGMRKLEYRWPTAALILADIKDGLDASAG
tara:strand:- start:26779 stop:28029 length:1251 start_codon:yes stop_codon:yes gene_type:complete